MAFVYYNFSNDDNICFADRSDYVDRGSLSFQVLRRRCCMKQNDNSNSHSYFIAFFKEKNASRIKNELTFQMKYGFKNIGIFS